jgi:hypothetical protein
VTRSHQRTVPLCFKHHKIEGGPLSVESLSHSGFYREWGIDLLKLADALYGASEALLGGHDAASVEQHRQGETGETESD